MRHRLLIVPGAALVLALGAYAIGQSATQSPGQSERPAERARGGTADQDAAAERERVNSYYQKKEEAVIAQLKLTPQQKREYDQLQAKLKEETAKMMALSSGHPQRGLEINQMLHEGLQRIFTNEQYESYMLLWSTDEADAVEEAQAQERRQAGREADEAILRDIGLTDEQWKGYYEMQIELNVLREEFRELQKGDDDKAVGHKGTEINRTLHARMQEILTPEQYQQWLDEWAAIMPKPKAGGEPVSPRRLVLRGSLERPIAGPADAEAKPEQKKADDKKE